MNDLLKGLSRFEMLAFITGLNFLILLLVALIGEYLVRRYAAHKIGSPPAISRKEILLVFLNLGLNIITTYAGYLLWEKGVIRFEESTLSAFVVDFLVLLFVMDFCMYVLHRIAHLSWLYPLLHKTHHEFTDPRPVTLFALNPLENLSFGGLWLAVIICYNACWAAVIVYMMFNVLSGLIGHLGVEPLPPSWKKMPVLKYISTSTFHAQHHQQVGHNYGFYTLIWDKLFHTLSSDYFKSK